MECRVQNYKTVWKTLPLPYVMLDIMLKLDAYIQANWFLFFSITYHILSKILNP